MDEIIKQIQEERAKQDELYGAPPHNLNASFFLTILTGQLGRLAGAIVGGDSLAYRTELIQIAAQAIAAIQEFDTGEALDGVEAVSPPIKYRSELEEAARAFENLVAVARANTPTEPPQPAEPTPPPPATELAAAEQV